MLTRSNSVSQEALGSEEEKTPILLTPASSPASLGSRSGPNNSEIPRTRTQQEVSHLFSSLVDSKFDQCCQTFGVKKGTKAPSERNQQ